MKTLFPSFVACLLITIFLATASAQKQTTDAEGNTVTTEENDKYGAGGSHVTTSDKNYKLVREKYYDKCGRLREECTYEKTGKGSTRTYWTPKGSDVVIVRSDNGVASYTDYFGEALSKEKGEALVKKWESTPSPPPPCPEKPGAAQPKVRPEAPPLVAPSGTSPLFGQPVSPSQSTWVGFYAGIEGNYTRSSADFSLKPTGDFEQFPDLSDELRFRGRHEFDGDGGGIGGYGGYNWMLCEHFVFGLEVEGRRVWGLKDHFETGDFDFGRLGMFDIHSSFNTEDIPYLVTFGPRLGYSWRNFLPYVRGGLAFGQVDAHQGILTSALGGNTNGKESTTQLGWCVGGGLEYALTDRWRLRVEYQYTDLGTVDFMGRGNPDSFRGFTTWNSAHVTEHSGNFGLGYSFPSFGR